MEGFYKNWAVKAVDNLDLSMLFCKNLEDQTAELI